MRKRNAPLVIKCLILKSLTVIKKLARENLCYAVIVKITGRWKNLRGILKAVGRGLSLALFAIRI